MLQVQSAAQFVETGGPRAARPLSPAQRRGLKYQAKVEGELERLFPGLLLPRPWFRYKANWEVHRCQPDGILYSPQRDRVSIVEVKYSTDPGCWPQLLKYRKVVEKAFRLPVALVLITRMFDPHRKFPCKIEQLENLAALGTWHGGEDSLGVVSWK